MQGLSQNKVDGALRDGRGPTRARGVLTESVEVVEDESLAPERHGVRLGLKFLGDLLVLPPFGGTKDDRRAEDEAMRRRTTARPLLERLPFSLGKEHHRGDAHGPEWGPSIIVFTYDSRH